MTSRKQREFQERMIDARAYCGIAQKQLGCAADLAYAGSVSEAASSVGKAEAFLEEALRHARTGALQLRGRRDKSAKKNPIERKSSQRIIVVDPNEHLPFDEKRTPQESEEERA